MSENPLYQRTAEPAEPLTPNQLVSYNLLRARRARGWTQQELGERIARYTGRAWSNASISAAERAWQGGRPRKFDADEIAAFCHVFDVPFGYFLLPPEDVNMLEISTAEDEQFAFIPRIPVIEYLKYILGVDPTAEFLDRAQESVSRHASLDFIPAKMEWIPDITPAAASAYGPGPKKRSIVEETIASRPDYLGTFKHAVANLGLPPDMVVDLYRAETADDANRLLAGYLEAREHLRIEDLERGLEELRKQVEGLMRERQHVNDS